MNRIWFNKSIYILKYTIILIILISCLISIPILLDKYSSIEISFIYKSIFNLSRLDVIHLYLCFPLSRLLQESIYFNELNPVIGLDEINYIDRLLENKTLDYLIKNTLNQNDLIDKIYLDTLAKKVVFKSQKSVISNKTMKKEISNEFIFQFADKPIKPNKAFDDEDDDYDNSTIVYHAKKCFEFNFMPEDFKSLIVKLKVNFYTIYLIEQWSRLTSKSKKYIDDFGYNPLFYRENKTKLCDNYPKRIDDLLCYSKYECVDRCNLIEHIRLYHHLSTRVVVYNDYLKKYSNLTYSNQFGNKTIEEDCRMRFKKECKTVIFKKHLHNNRNYEIKSYKKEFTIDISQKCKIHRTLSTQNRNERILSILTLFTCLIDLNMPRLFNIFAILASLSYSSKSSLNKLFHLFIYFMLFLHIKFLYEDTFKSSHYEIVPSLYYTERITPKDLPDFILCFDFDIKKLMQTKSQLNGHDLVYATQDLNLNTIIDKIQFVNSSFRMQNVYPNQNLNAISNLKISYFFLFDKKCFNLSLDLDILNSRLAFINFIFSIKFNKKFKQKVYLKSFIRNYLNHATLNKQVAMMSDHYCKAKFTKYVFIRKDYTGKRIVNEEDNLLERRFGFKMTYNVDATL